VSAEGQRSLWPSSPEGEELAGVARPLKSAWEKTLYGTNVERRIEKQKSSGSKG